MLGNTLLSNYQRSTHSYVIGQPGTGKSKAMESWIMQDIDKGHGCGVIDPHGDLYRNLCRHLAQKPEHWDRLVLIDPLDNQWVTGLNPLAPLPWISSQRIGQYMTDIMVKIWGLSQSSAPRLIWLMNNSFTALSDAQLGLADLPQFLMDRDFREHYLRRVKSPIVRSFFHDEFPHSQAGVHQWVTPLLNKIGPLLLDEDISLFLQARPALDFTKLIDESRILLVNLPKGILGEGVSALFGAFIVARLQKAALRRSKRSYREPFYLYLDEFQNYTTDNIVDILAESRKYALSLTLAHQYLAQLSSSIRSAVLNTSGTLIAFRVGLQDARFLGNEFFGANNSTGPMRIKVGQASLWPQVRPTLAAANKNTESSLRLTQLRKRDFWVKRRGRSRATKHRSYTIPDPQMNRQLEERLQRMRNASGRKFGLHRDEIKTQKRDSRHKDSIPETRFWTQ